MKERDIGIGWAVIPDSWKEHFFDHNGVSLCKKFSIDPKERKCTLNEDENDYKYNCAFCQRELHRLKFLNINKRFSGGSEYV